MADLFASLTKIHQCPANATQNSVTCETTKPHTAPDNASSSIKHQIVEKMQISNKSQTTDPLQNRQNSKQIGRLDQ